MAEIFPKIGPIDPSNFAPFLEDAHGKKVSMIDEPWTFNAHNCFRSEKAVT